MPATPTPAPDKRSYAADPAMTHERAVRAAKARNHPDSYIRSLERAQLTAEQKLRLALLVLSFGSLPGNQAGAR